MLLRRIKRFLKRLKGVEKFSRREAQDYWKSPPARHAGNTPRSYARADLTRSEALLGYVERLSARDDKILELGCNAGRNLNHLRKAGFKNLTGVELNRSALDEFRSAFPDTAGHVVLKNMSIEEFLPSVPDKSFDLIYTMAVLIHLPYESDFVFREMVRCAKAILVVEDETETYSRRRFARNYKKTFEDLGAVQAFEERPVPGLEDYLCRAFRC